MWRSALSVFSPYSESEVVDICGFRDVVVSPKTSFTVAISALYHAFRIQNSAEISASCFAAIYAVAIQEPLCFNVMLTLDITTLNYVAANDIQTGFPNGDNPYRDRGLDGSGQVIGSCDTGVDLASCYFREPVGGPVSGLCPSHSMHSTWN